MASDKFKAILYADDTKLVIECLRQFISCALQFTRRRTGIGILIKMQIKYIERWEL